jgi:cell division protease FtsH
MERCAYHEAGHAVIAHILMPKVPVSEVSINGRGSNAGWTKLDSPSVSSLAEIKASLSMLLAGRAAAVHKFGPDAISQGDSGDLQKATQLALAAITENGMDEVIGHVHIDSMNKQCGDAIGALVLTRTRVWIDEAMQTAATTLAEQWETVELLVEKLLLHGELRGEMLEKCLNRDCQKVCAE